MKKSKKGFTLIELIVVLAILAVVAAIAVPTAFGSIEKARVSADSASLDAFNSAIRVQAALISADKIKTGNTVTDAFNTAGFASGKYKVQSTNGLRVSWVGPQASGCGYFTIVDTDGTLIAQNGDFYDQLIAIAKKDTTSGEKIVN